jgi:hypothetical protein
MKLKHNLKFSQMNKLVKKGMAAFGFKVPIRSKQEIRDERKYSENDLRNAHLSGSLGESLNSFLKSIR